MELNTLLISFQDSILFLITFQNMAILLVAFLTLSFYALSLERKRLAQNFVITKITTENNSFLEEVETLTKKNTVDKKQLEKTIEELLGRNSAIEERFSKVVDVDNEVLNVLSEKQKIEKAIEKMQQSYKEQEDNLAKKLSTEKSKNTKAVNVLNSDYKKKKALFNKLVKLVAIYDEEIELAELGFYKPRYDFDTSEKYKERLEKVKAKQKKLVTSKEAIYCDTEWTIEGNRTKGKAQTNQNIKLTARAFNNECNDITSNARWNNALRMRLRISKAFDSINKLNESNRVYISEKYLQLKIDEFNLAYEYKEKKKDEQKEQSIIRQQMREEAKLEQETEKAFEEEEKYQKLLDKAKADAEKATGKKLEGLEKKISELSEELVLAHEKSERAKSMAQQTKAGHVYVISNRGSFGEGVHKIGMTRRLEPYDRVKELGDASVPFIFDVHAMIYSTDAPNLERTLHKAFELKRVNLVNNRKEFFNVSLEEIEKEVKITFPDIEFIVTSEARQYRESTALREQKKQRSLRNDVQNSFPSSL